MFFHFFTIKNIFCKQQHNHDNNDNRNKHIFLSVKYDFLSPTNMSFIDLNYFGRVNREAVKGRHASENVRGVEKPEGNFCRPDYL